MRVLNLQEPQPCERLTIEVAKSAEPLAVRYQDVCLSVVSPGRAQVFEVFRVFNGHGEPLTDDNGNPVFTWQPSKQVKP